MIKFKSSFTTLLSFLIIFSCSSQSHPKTSIKDFTKLEGSWKGSLTYLDYSSGKPYTMQADVVITRIAKTNQFSFSNSYPKEASANGFDTISIAKKGNYINKELVKSRKKLTNGDIEIVTEEQGMDGNDNKRATFRHTYTFGKTTYTNKKDVQFAGETNWINRHLYTYHRKNGP